MFAFRNDRVTTTEVFAEGSFCDARSYSTWNPLSSSAIESGGCETPAWIEPARSAAVRCAAEPTAMIVTSLSASRPIRFSAARVAISDDDPTVDTPIFLPFRSFMVLMSAATSRTNG